MINDVMRDGHAVTVRFTKGTPGAFDAPCIYLLDDGSIHEGYVMLATSTFKAGALITSNHAGGIHETFEIPLRRVVGWAHAGPCEGRAATVDAKPESRPLGVDQAANPVAAGTQNRGSALVLMIFLSWALVVAIGLYASWPATKLVQDPLPKLPTLEECQSRDYLECFGSVVRKRETLVYEQKTFTENYPDRVMWHLAAGLGVFVSPFAILCAIAFLGKSLFSDDTQIKRSRRKLYSSS